MFDSICWSVCFRRLCCSTRSTARPGYTSDPNLTPDPKWHPIFLTLAPKKRGLHYTPLRSNYLVQFTLCKKKLLLRPHSTVNYGTIDPASVGFQPMVTLQCYQRYVRQAQRRFLKLHLRSFRQNIFLQLLKPFFPLCFTSIAQRRRCNCRDLSARRCNYLQLRQLLLKTFISFYWYFHFTLWHTRTFHLIRHFFTSNNHHLIESHTRICLGAS